MGHQFNNQVNPVHVDMAKCEPEQRKQYSRMVSQSGKTDRPRNIYTDAFRRGWDLAFGKKASK